MYANGNISVSFNRNQASESQMIPLRELKFAPQKHKSDLFHESSWTLTFGQS